MSRTATVRRRRGRAVATGIAALLPLGAATLLMLEGIDPTTAPVPPARGLHVDPHSIGGRCSDHRTVAQARTPGHPWCTAAHAAAAAPDGSIVLLRGGSHGQLSIVGQRRARGVTFKGYPGEHAELPEGLHIEDSAGFSVEGLRVTSRGYTSSIFASDRISVLRSSFSPRGLLIRASSHVKVAGNDFHDIRRVPGAGAPDGYALYVQAVLRGVPGEEVRSLTIRGNRFRNVPNDGIQLAGGSSRVHDVRIEGNEFAGIRRVVATDHPDSIQIIGGDGVVIRSNIFRDSEVALMIKDDVTRSLVVEDNLMIGAEGSGIQAQL
jgi:Right handed beta helix region